jgi:hypothetical protein
MWHLSEFATYLDIERMTNREIMLEKGKCLMLYGGKCLIQLCYGKSMATHCDTFNPGEKGCLQHERL